VVVVVVVVVLVVLVVLVVVVDVVVGTIKDTPPLKSQLEYLLISYKAIMYLFVIESNTP
jgi:hypothetical protein